jgi:hypothetical protein
MSDLHMAGGLEFADAGANHFSLHFAPGQKRLAI